MANKRKTRDAHAEGLELVGVRLPTALVARLDERLETMKTQMPGVELHRSDVIRTLLSTALAAK
jgi:hypothetical protein